MDAGWLYRQVLLAKGGMSAELTFPQEKSDVLEQGLQVTPRRWGDTSQKAVTQSRTERSW